MAFEIVGARTGSIVLRNTVPFGAMDPAGRWEADRACTFMTRWIDSICDETWRSGLGRRFEALTGDVFNVLRWAIVVGFSRFLAIETDSAGFHALHWATSVMLFAYLASRFLLRPEIPIFAERDKRWKRITQSTINYVLCMLLFMIVMHILNQLIDGIAQYRFAWRLD